MVKENSILKYTLFQYSNIPLYFWKIANENQRPEEKSWTSCAAIHPWKNPTPT